MRVLFVNHTAIVSGAEHSLLTLIRGLPSGFVAGIACPDGPLVHMAREQGVDSYRIRGTSGSLRLHPWHTAVGLGEIGLSGVQLARAARRSGASVLHANSVRAGLTSCIACRIHDQGLVVHVRDCMPDSATTRVIRRVVAREADQVVATSEYVSQCFRAGRFQPDVRVRVIDNPVDLNRFRSDLRGPDSARRPGQPLLVIVGQISSWKGHDTAIRALHGLRLTYPDARLLIVGEVKFAHAATRFDNRGYLAELHKLVRDLGLVEAVEFIGEREDVPTIMALADVVLVPSIEEPFGRTVAEAMAVGTPVVATSIGGPAELIENGVTGLLASPGEPLAWRDAIRSILEDPGRAREMALRANHVAKRRFATQTSVAATLSVYSSIASARMELQDRPAGPHDTPATDG